MKNLKDLCKLKNQKTVLEEFNTTYAPAARLLFDSFRKLSIPKVFVRVLISGSSAWQFINMAYGFQHALLPNTDIDSYLFGKDDDSSAYLNKHREGIGAGIADTLLIPANDRKKGRHFYQMKHNGYDYALIESFEALSNFNVLIDHNTGEIVYDASISTHEEDFKRFIEHGEIISYHLESLMENAFRFVGEDKNNYALHKLAYVLKSYIKPMQVGKTFHPDTAETLFGLLSKQKNEFIAWKLKARMRAH